MTATGRTRLAIDQGGHGVQFYDHDGELADGAGRYLAGVLAAGHAVVIAATAAHRSMLAGQLASRCDVTAARARGLLTELNAQRVLNQFVIGDRPDPAGFEQVIGGALRRAAAGGRPVHVYGEVVALLWEAGQVAAAVELEALWNELAALVPFTLVCGYPVGAVTGEDHADALESVCGLHSAVTGLPPATAEQEFGCAERSPRAARQFVTQTLQQWGEGAVAGDAAIVVTELATNAVVHACSGFTLWLSRSADAVRISVRDHRPLPRGSASLTTSPGHGLGIVSAIASDWAVQPRPGGKTVWAEIRG